MSRLLTRISGGRDDGRCSERPGSAGGKQDQQANDWLRLDGDPIVTVGDTVEGHDPHEPAVMLEGEDWFRVGGRAVCRAEHKASCGHGTTGRQWFRLIGKNSPYRDYIESAADPCNIEHIPWIMRANGWHEGAKLMDQCVDPVPNVGAQSGTYCIR